jgi:hypothetical protein
MAKLAYALFAIGALLLIVVAANIAPALKSVGNVPAGFEPNPTLMPAIAITFGVLIAAAIVCILYGLKIQKREKNSQTKLD